MFEISVTKNKVISEISLVLVPTNTILVPANIFYKINTGRQYKKSICQLYPHISPRKLISYTVRKLW